MTPRCSLYIFLFSSDMGGGKVSEEVTNGGSHTTEVDMTEECRKLRGTMSLRWPWPLYILIG